MQVYVIVPIMKYSHFYTRAFESGKGHINAFVRKALRNPGVRHRYMVSKHADTLRQTQSIGVWINARTATAIYRTHTLARLARLTLLRKLQRRILQYLWRPGGTLMRRDMALHTQA